jgi:RNA polymerase sigma factor (sigma-70 family)
MAGNRSIGGGSDPDVAAVAAVVAGETARFGEIYRRHYARVHSYARGLLRDSAEAEDIAQETFLLALRALPRYEDRGLPFRAWLLRIAHNAALKRLGARSGPDRRASQAGPRWKAFRLIPGPQRRPSRVAAGARAI